VRSSTITLGQSGKRTGTRALDASRWLAFAIAILMAVSTMFHDRHAQAATADKIRYIVETSHTEPAAGHSHVGSRGADRAQDDGSCHVSPSGCAICVPVSAQIVIGPMLNEPPAIAPSSISLPGDVLLRLRPPRSPRSPKRALPFWFVRSTISNPRSHGYENQRAQGIYRHASFWHPPGSVRPPAPPHPWSL
jgi:hypothetical protein